MARVVRLRREDEAGEALSIESQLADVVAACVRKSGRSPEQFAHELDQRSPRRPGVIGGTVRAAMSGTHPLQSDLLCYALTIAGLDASVLLRVLRAMLVA